ncbi:MAG: hypothetical protein SFU83_18695 [Meiothermus sp.]|nr:hypothetical protein [Meiothermus sp.]
MNQIHPILAEVFTSELRQQTQAAGATSFKTDELALWQADQKASGCPEAVRPHVLKIGHFTFWLSKPKPQPC